MNSRFAFVTLLTKISYLPGTLVLDYGLRAVSSRYPLVVMVTPSLPDEARTALRSRGILMREVQPLRPLQGVHTLVAHDARFADTWTKLRGFELSEYDRIVLLDCDMIVLRNMDELLTLELPKDYIAAVHVCACNPRGLVHYPTDWIPENCPHTAVTSPTALPPHPTISSPRPYTQLNSGTVVLHPSNELAESITNFLATHNDISQYSFPDQDLLTEYFKSKWKPIPWYYNALKTLRVIHQEEWSDEEVRCLHYILPDKPWLSRITSPELKEYGIVNGWWWEQFDQLVEQMSKGDQDSLQLVLSNVDNRR